MSTRLLLRFEIIGHALSLEMAFVEARKRMAVWNEEQKETSAYLDLKLESITLSADLFRTRDDTMKYYFAVYT